MPGHPEVDRPLAAANTGGRDALDALLPAVYRELRVLAHHQLSRFRPGETLNTTALVHEAYLKLVDHRHATFNDRKHFFTVAALAMRQIVVDYARQRCALKRGGGAPHAGLDELDRGVGSVQAQATALTELDGALTVLAGVDERLVRVVELRFFGGLSVEEAAEVLDVSTATVKRDTRAARAFLAREMARAASG